MNKHAPHLHHNGIINIPRVYRDYGCYWKKRFGKKRL